MGPNAGTCSMDYTTTFLSYSFEQTVYIQAVDGHLDVRLTFWLQPSCLFQVN